MAADTDSKSIFDTFGNDTVTIKVGPESIPFPTHKKLLCSKSPYFERMFNVNFHEAKTNIAEEKETDPAGFELFVHWLYRGEISVNTAEVTQCKDLARRDEILIAFYRLADKFMLGDSLKKSLVSKITWDESKIGIPLRRARITPAAVHTSIKDLPEDDAMRRAVMRAACDNLTKYQDTKWLDECLMHMDEETTKQFFKKFAEASAHAAKQALKRKRKEPSDIEGSDDTSSSDSSESESDTDSDDEDRQPLAKRRYLRSKAR